MRAGRIGVIGAGIAGLVTAKVLREDGFEVIVFEKEQAIGGVWTQSRTYPGLRTNNSRDTYAFSDHPYDRSADIFPSAEQVRAYLASYVAGSSWPRFFGYRLRWCGCLATVTNSR
ncbi:FAD-dependent oxidoreductase [Mycobacterium servetii]|uniref:FAD-dependent oxidoreductase n=1 Tax=Mycobacterium servetii TaxID=3237418 RepID=A0ABV4BVU0_9MYCO